MIVFSEVGDWLVDKVVWDMGLQMICVGGNVYNFILDLVISSFGSNFKFFLFWLIIMLDFIVYKILEYYVGLDLSKLSVIIVDLFFVRSFMFVVLVIIGYIVVVLLWSLYIKWVGLKFCL